MWLSKCLKSLVSEHRWTVSMLNALKKYNKALPSYCFITLAKVQFENVGLSVSAILGFLVNTLITNDKY